MEFENEEEEKEQIFNPNKFNKWVNKQESDIIRNYLKIISFFKHHLHC